MRMFLALFSGTVSCSISSLCDILFPLQAHALITVSSSPGTPISGKAASNHFSGVRKKEPMSHF